jgi:hypothetical protein
MRSHFQAPGCFFWGYFFLDGRALPVLKFFPRRAASGREGTYLREQLIAFYDKGTIVANTLEARARWDIAAARLIISNSS